MKAVGRMEGREPVEEWRERTTIGNNPMCPLLLGSRGRPSRDDERKHKLRWMKMLASQVRLRRR